MLVQTAVRTAVEKISGLIFFGYGTGAVVKWGFIGKLALRHLGFFRITGNIDQIYFN